MSAALVAISLHRWSIGAVAGLCLLLTALAGWLAWDIASAVASCRENSATAACTELATIGTLRAQDVVRVTGLLGVLPFIGGVLLGGPLVAREVEQRTASLAWPLAVSRLRWLTRVALPVIGIGTLMTIPPAAAGFLLVATYAPDMDPTRTFEHFGLYGSALVFRFVAVAVLALLAGIWLGRTLPALIASAAAAAILFFALSSTTTIWLAPVALPQAQHPGEGLGDLFVRQMVRLPNGELISVEEAEVTDPSLNEVTESVDYGVPADRAPEVAWRETGALLIGSTGALVVAVRTIRRRRPY